MIAKLLAKLWAKPRKPAKPFAQYDWRGLDHDNKLAAAKIRLGKNWVLHKQYNYNTAHGAVHGVVLQEVKISATAARRI